MEPCEGCNQKMFQAAMKRNLGFQNYAIIIPIAKELHTIKRNEVE
jgi:hypothetical protein